MLSVMASKCIVKERHRGVNGEHERARYSCTKGDNAKVARVMKVFVSGFRCKNVNIFFVRIVGILLGNIYSQKPHFSFYPGIFLNQRRERARSSDHRTTHTSISPRKEASTAIRSPVLNYSCKWHRCLNYHALSALLRDTFGRSGEPG
ncbi:hypothetical protein HZU73_02291 [Apis mellifera caucasica]|uniref:Uncharacterized protein LOC100578162 n=1 Tax=Apis mellifera TaxID=7460 RepID=A0A7M7MQK0_APIME|nr:uncharacterized protein LOC100578162 [Apis mellifera]XP_016770679.1 uncharacterized protein LOC100578162 [Apis mellifera]XP_026299435.1 uncharacterized protein LOC100578162 [Apis mellifera]KAG6802385.1 hypothetical protein HZU73_02291 [Apis mellifera caucasica]|eukprot:XP_003249206.1 uncharacterized protein LOC100578162 [Apis mellifera]